MGNAIPFPGGPPKEGGFPSRNVPISAVPRIARICSLGLVFDELLNEVCREILALSGADGGCLFLSARDERSETFSPAAESGTLPGVGGAYRPGPALERLLDRMRTEGRIQADDLSLQPASDPLKRLLDPFPVRSALLIPLRFGTRLLGFVALHVTGAPKPWGGEVLSAMDMVAAILSAALERRRAEDRLRASEARYRFLTEHSPDLITLHDATGRILYASPASLPMLGVRPELMTGSPIEGFLHPDDAGNVVAEIGRTAGGEKPDASLPYRMRGVDGRYVDVESSSTSFPEGPEGDRRVLRVTRDISGRRKMEARLAEGQTLSTIGMLAGGVAHEFNNALAAIHGRRRASFDARRGEPPGPHVPRRDPADGEPRHGIDPTAPGVLAPGEVHARFDPAGARAVGDPPGGTDVPPARGRALGGMRRCASARPCGRRPDEAGRDGALPERRGGDDGRRPALGPHVFRARGRTRRPRGVGHGARDRRRDDAPHLRAVLHDEGRRTRDGAGGDPGDRRKPRRRDPDRLPGREGDDVHRPPSGERRPRRRRSRPPRRDRRRAPAGCCWRTTRRTCGAWSARCSKPSGTR